MNVDSKPFEAPANMDRSSKTELESKRAGPDYADSETLQTRGGRGGASRGNRGGGRNAAQPKKR